MKYNILHFISYAIVVTAIVICAACGDKTGNSGNTFYVAGGGATGIAGGDAVGSGTLPGAGSSGQTTGSFISGAGGGGTSPQGGNTATGAAGAVAKGSVVTCPGQATPLQDGACKKNATGIFALRLDIPVYWADKSLLGLVSVVDSGRGYFQYFAKLEINSVCEDGKFDAKLHTCGIRIPTFYSTLVCEGFELEASDSAWDRPDIAPFAVKGSYDGFAPGNGLALNTMDYLFGIDLKDATGKWPTSDETLTYACSGGTGKACFPDYDRDGKQGITLLAKSAAGNVLDTGCNGASPFKRGYPPLSADLTALLGGAARADEMYVGFRIKAGGGGKIASDCVTSGGVVPADYLNSRSSGCIVKEGTQDFLGNPAGPNTPCSDAQSSFLDSQFPDFQTMDKGETPPASSNVKDTSASVGTIASMVRLGENNQTFSCADVRNAPFVESK
jgi:hypothetical protein